MERGHTVDWHIEAHSRQEAAAVLRRPSRLAGGRVGWESASGLHALRDEGYTRPIEPARALAAEALTLERTLSGLVNQAYFPASMRSRYTFTRLWVAIADSIWGQIRSSHAPKSEGGKPQRVALRKNSARNRRGAGKKPPLTVARIQGLCQ